MSGTKYASKLTIGGETYVLKDKEARDAIANLQSADTTINGRIDQLAAANNVTTSDAVYQYAERLYNEANAEAVKAAAEAKWTVNTTSTDASTVYTDTVPSASITVTVVTKWNGTAKDATTTPTGWTRTDVGTYTKPESVDATGTATVSAESFSYTPSASDFENGETPYLESITKSSEEKSKKLANAVYYGFATTNDKNSIVTVIGSLTRSVAKVTLSSITATSDGSYLWILTKTSATAKQMTQSILGSAQTVSFTSPRNANITLSNYKLYISTSPFDSGSQNIDITINV